MALGLVVVDLELAEVLDLVVVLELEVGLDLVEDLAEAVEPQESISDPHPLEVGAMAESWT